MKCNEINSEVWRRFLKLVTRRFDGRKSWMGVVSFRVLSNGNGATSLVRAEYWLRLLPRKRILIQVCEVVLFALKSICPAWDASQLVMII